MADFHQTGVVTTLHRLQGGGLERTEKAPAMRRMAAGLAHARYLKE